MNLSYPTETRTDHRKEKEKEMKEKRNGSTGPESVRRGAGRLAGWCEGVLFRISAFVYSHSISRHSVS
jgi:hypothetical protein